MSQTKLLEVAGQRSWPSLGLLGVGSWLSQAVLHSVNWPNLSVDCGLSSKLPCSGKPQGDTKIAPRGPPQPPSLSAGPLSWLRPEFCRLHLGTQSILFLLPARLVAASSCLCLFKRERRKEIRKWERAEHGGLSSWCGTRPPIFRSPRPMATRMPWMRPGQGSKP